MNYGHFSVEALEILIPCDLFKIMNEFVRSLKPSQKSRETNDNVIINSQPTLDSIFTRTVPGFVRFLCNGIVDNGGATPGTR